MKASQPHSRHKHFNEASPNSDARRAGKKTAAKTAVFLAAQILASRNGTAITPEPETLPRAQQSPLNLRERQLHQLPPHAWTA